MRKIILLSLFLASPPAWGINYFWCEKDLDCAKVYSGCGRYDSVHRRYKGLYEAKAHKGDKVSFCHKPTEVDKKYKFEGQPVCKKMRCRLTLKGQKS